MSAPIPERSHAEIQELLGAYALDAVDKETAALVEQHLAGCVRCSVEVSQHHEVAGLLANSGGASPASLWDGIASQLDSSTPPSWEGLAERLETGGDRVVDPTDAVVVPITARTRRGRWARRAGAVVGAAAAVLALVLGLQVHHLNNQVTALQSHPSLSAAEQAALREPSTMVVPLRATAGGRTSSGGSSAARPSPSACWARHPASSPSAWPGTWPSTPSPSPPSTAAAWSTAATSRWCPAR